MTALELDLRQLMRRPDARHQPRGPRRRDRWGLLRTPPAGEPAAPPMSVLPTCPTRRSSTVECARSRRYRIGWDAPPTPCDLARHGSRVSRDTVHTVARELVIGGRHHRTFTIRARDLAGPSPSANPPPPSLAIAVMIRVKAPVA